MATVGYTTTPSGSYNNYQVNINNLLVSKVTMPQAGQITSISCYIAAHVGSGNTTARFCVWDSNGNLLAQSADITLTPGTGSIGGQSWVTANLTSAYNASNGQVLFIGAWRHWNQSHEWTEDSNANVEYSVTGGDGSNTVPPASESFTSAGGNPGIYATYTPNPVFPSTLFVDDGTNLRAVSGFAYDGTQLRTISIFIFDGTSLRQVM